MKHILLLLSCLILSVGTLQAKNDYKETVVLSCNLHCQGCCDKIMKNIAYEKGVKDLQFDLKNKTVTLTFDKRKTDLPTLLKAFEKLGKPATVKKDTKQTSEANK